MISLAESIEHFLLIFLGETTIVSGICQFSLQEAKLFLNREILFQ